MRAGVRGTRGVPVHAKIGKPESTARVHVVEVHLERNHDVVQRSGFGTRSGSGRPRSAPSIVPLPSSGVKRAFRRGKWHSVGREVAGIRREHECLVVAARKNDNAPVGEIHPQRPSFDLIDTASRSETSTRSRQCAATFAAPTPL